MRPLCPQLQRLAFVQEWSDELICHLLETCERSGKDVLVEAEKAANELALAHLREGGDQLLAQSAAARFGFSNIEDLHAFAAAHPALSARQKADAAILEAQGVVTSISLTEVVFSTDDGRCLAFEKAKLPDIKVGETVRVEKYGRMRLMKTDSNETT